jgi:hypothetical protein
MIGPMRLLRSRSEYFPSLSATTVLEVFPEPSRAVTEAPLMGAPTATVPEASTGVLVAMELPPPPQPKRTAAAKAVRGRIKSFFIASVPFGF